MSSLLIVSTAHVYNIYIQLQVVTYGYRLTTMLGDLKTVSERNYYYIVRRHLAAAAAV